MALSTWRRIEAALDRFIPPAILASPEPARRARLAVALAWLSAVLFIVAAVVQSKVNSSELLVFNLASAAICCAAPFAIRRFGVALICNVVIAVSFAKYLAVVAVLRGPGLNGATIMLSLLPFVATFLLGARTGLVWAALSLVSGITIALLGRAGVIVDHLPPERRLVNDHFILAISTVILFAIAWLYERIKDAAQRQIYELEAARRAAELERVHAVARSQLAEAQRLASLGRIAAATAHEINSPLAAVIANLQLAEEQQTLSNDVAESIREALASARRIGAIVADMNAYSRPRVESGTISVAEAVATAVKLAQPHTQARARVTQQIADDLPRVVADTGLIDVVLDLVVLAAETFSEGQASANEIIISATASADNVSIDVTDVADSSTNLALALCRTIVDKLGGTLTIEAGARPIARLVLAAAKPAPAAAVAPAAARLAILVVDDDEAILTMLKRVLSAHSITIARGGREALALCDTRGFDLILCDLMMPELTGMDLYEQLIAKDATYAARFVFMTGGTFTRRADEFRQTVANHFVEKPFNLRDIRQIIAGFAVRGEKQRGAPTAA